MEFQKLDLDGLTLITPRLFNDSRGYFFESYNRNAFTNAGIDTEFIQDNQSFSTYGTIRGMHLQLGEHAQAKLVRVVVGEVLDIVVDIRKESKTFGKSYSVILTADNQKQLFIPRGFAHGFAVLSQEAIFQYKVDNFYNKDSESGFKFDDSSLQLDWQLPFESFTVSDKDKMLPSFDEFKALL